ncbi:hypothetical protein HK105_202564 [Polyrhizophydium stewartii]|uniref:LITAF domain-containing protein n=1 Tax=Polyrhizophydium stewartii TaxID=2732419 RepID=A0ABR4NDV2_9FUNG
MPPHIHDSPLAPRELPTLVMQPPSPIVCPFCNQTVVPVLRTFESYSADTNKKAFFLWGCCCIPCLLFPMWGGSRVQKTVMQCPNCQTFIQ